MQELCPGVNLQASSIEGTDFVRLSYGFGGTAGINATRRRRPPPTSHSLLPGNGTGAEVISPQVDEDGMLAQRPEGLFDEWENSLDQLLD